MQYEEYRPRESQISVAQLIKVMIGYKRKSLIRLAIITVAIWLIGFLAIFFGYNPMKETYQTDWSYSISTFDGDSYLDGSHFYFPDLISLDNLKDIKDSNEEFKNIDIEKLISKDAITIKKNTVSETNVYKFTITAQKNYFSSEEQAISFIEAIVETPIRIINGLIDLIDNTQYLAAYKNYSVTYSDLISALKNQTDVITKGYSDLMTSYGNRYFTTEAGKTYLLNDLFLQVKSTISSMQLDTLNEIVENKSYVNDYEKELPLLQTTLDSLTDDLNLVNKKIKAIQDEIERQINLGASASTLDSLNSTLGPLLISKEEITNKISIIENQINYGDTQDTSDFDATLEADYQTLLGITNEYTYVQKNLHRSYQKIFYSTNNVVNETGGMGTLTALALPLIIGLVVGVIVNLCIDLKPFVEAEKAKKKAEAEGKKEE